LREKRERERKFVYVRMYACMYVCVFDRRVSPLLRKEQQQHEYNKDKKKKERKDNK